MALSGAMGRGATSGSATVASPLPESHVPLRPSPPSLIAAATAAGRLTQAPARRATPRSPAAAQARPSGATTSTRIEPVTLTTTVRPAVTRQSRIVATVVWPWSQSGGRRRCSSQR